jgi:hypothetical protein
MLDGTLWRLSESFRWSDSTTKTNSVHRNAEISSSFHHPNKPSTLAAFSKTKYRRKEFLQPGIDLHRMILLVN